MKTIIACGLFGILITLFFVYAIAACFAFAYLDAGMFNPSNWTAKARGSSMLVLIVMFLAGLVAGANLEMGDYK